LRASGDNNTRFLFVDGFVPGSLSADLASGSVRAKVFVDEGGGKHFQYHVTMHLGEAAVESYRRSEPGPLLAQTGSPDWMKIDRAKKTIAITFI
jgi:hypothetical protein